MAWWLAYEELYGDMDKEYPIMNKKDEVTILGGSDEDTLNVNFPTGNAFAADTISFSGYSWSDDGFSVTGNPAGSSQDTLNLGPTRLPGGMGEDHISFSGFAGTAFDDPKYYARDFGDDPYPTLGSIFDSTNSPVQDDVDDVYKFHYPGTEEWERIEKPKPDLKGSSNQKYQEDKGIKDLKDYVSSTYQGHYTNDNSDVQTLDLIHSVGDAESFCRSNALKYLSRYDKKGQAKRDILKAMHYCLLLYYFSGQTNDEITTRGYETF